MLASGRESEGNEGAEKRIPSVPLGRGLLRRGDSESCGKVVDNNGLNVDKPDEKQPRVRVSNSLLAETQKNC
jgi:hypothetical protein